MVLALIGAVIGSIGSNIVSHLLKQRSERESIRRSLIDKYLLQLQDAVDSLWYRFNNLSNLGGQQVMDEVYYEESTLYSLGCVLAYKRILLLDGIYSQLEDSGRGLKQSMQDLDSEMNILQFRSRFFHYDKLALGESVMEKEENHLRTCTYLEFKNRYENDDTRLKQSLKPAKDFILNLDALGVTRILEILQDISTQLEKETRIPSGIKLRKKS